MRAIVVNRCNQCDAKLAAEAQSVVDAHTAGRDYGGSEANIRLKTLLELQTILCTEYRYAHRQPRFQSRNLTVTPYYRNAYFTIISLAGAGIFNFVRDHHRQYDGVLEADAARMDDMVDRIRCAAEE